MLRVGAMKQRYRVPLLLVSLAALRGGTMAWGDGLVQICGASCPYRRRLRAGTTQLVGESPPIWRTRRVDPGRR